MKAPANPTGFEATETIIDPKKLSGFCSIQTIIEKAAVVEAGETVCIDVRAVQRTGKPKTVFPYESPGYYVNGEHITQPKLLKMFIDGTVKSL